MTLLKHSDVLYRLAASLHDLEVAHKSSTEPYDFNMGVLIGHIEEAVRETADDLCTDGA